MLHSTSPSDKSASSTAKRPLFGGAALSVIVVSLAVGASGVLFMSKWSALCNQLTRKPPESDYINTDPRLSDDQKLMYTLTHIGGSKAVAAVQTIVARDDKRFVPVLIEMLEANEARRRWIGAGPLQHVRALEALTGEDFRDEAFDEQKMARFWTHWYQTTALVPPHGFTSWKGSLLCTVSGNSHLRTLLRDGVPSTVRVEEIHLASATRQFRPMLDAPGKLPANAVPFMPPFEPILGVRVNNQSCAYPLRVVGWHNIVNDEIGGIPLALTSCPMTGAVVCYDARGKDGRKHRFAPTGVVYRGNDLLADIETFSLWCQITGQCVLGTSSDPDFRLRTIPVVLTTWSEWHEDHPDTQVLQLKPDFQQTYEAGISQANFVRAPLPPRPNQLLPASERVFGLIAEEPNAGKAFPVKLLTSEKVINDTVGKTPVVLVANNGNLTTERRQRSRNPAVRFSLGAEVRAYRRGTEIFHPSSDSDEIVIDAAGKSWEITEEALLGPGNRRIPRIDGVQAYWAGWQTFHPETAVFQPAR